MNVFSLFSLVYAFLWIGLVDAVIVDDTDDSIVYSNSPSWVAGTTSSPSYTIKWGSNNEGSAYGGTWHEGDNYGNIATLTFTGTSISVVGIIAKLAADTSLGFTLDGGTQENYQNNVVSSTVYQEITSAENLTYGVTVYSKSGLAATQHTLVVETFLQASMFGLDYFEYDAVDAATTSAAPATTPGTTASGRQSTTSGTGASSGTGAASTSTATGSHATSGNSGSGTSATHDSNTPPTMDILPSDPRIIYNPQQYWASGVSCQMTSMKTGTNNATFSFNFTGTAIWLYTSQSESGGTYSVSVDGEDKGSFNTYSTVSTTTSASSAGCQIKALYIVTNLNDTSHTLVLKNDGSSSSSGGSGIIDFVGFRLTASAAVGDGGGDKSPSTTNIAAIVGGAIGGLAGIILIAFMGYLCLRRQRRQDLDKDLGSNYVPAVGQFNVNSPALLNETTPVPMTEKQRLAAAMGLIQNQNGLSSESQAHLFPPTSKRRLLAQQDSSDSSSTSHPHEQGQPPNNHQPPYRIPLPPAQLLPNNSPPPSFRTRPLSHINQYFAIPAPNTYNSGSSERDNDDHYDHSDPQPNSRQHHYESSNTGDTDYSQVVPPYVEDVLSRPDARNLSEADVDMIARRLADVMRVQSNRRDRDPDQPGLFQAWPAPPRELIDQMVEEHLEAREIDR